MLRRLLMSVLAAVVPLAGLLAPGAATAATTAACTSGVSVSQFSFDPSSVPPTGDSALTLVLQNCGSQAVQGSSDWYPALTSSGTGLPPGCPHLDPVAFTYALAPGATSTATLGLGDPIAGCVATGLQVTANVYENGVTGAVATATADLVITPPTPNGCHVTYTPGNWPGGFTANVTIANNGTSTINSWTLTFAFPGDHKITNAWNATVTQNGTSIAAANLGYNASIAPGGSQSFGFQGTWTARDTPPTAFSVNGTPCS